MRHAPRAQGIGERADDVLLAGEVGEALRPVLAREDEVRSGHRVDEALDRRPGTRLKPLPLLPSGPGGFTTRRRPVPGPAPRLGNGPSTTNRMIRGEGKR